ncbi:XRE family transcriptional regulator [Novosphingobium aquiterrae]|uniref:Transcriptional regulator, XRE family n=2 Tax=Sphingomonadaceae TaxID=41297 RepID=A0A9J9LGM7_RHIWR|nr:transcriptional regulator, XRE family [Rhizorhabdus wittichii RW1]
MEHRLKGAQAEAREALIEALRSALSELDLSQVAAARLLETDQPTLSRLLSGQRTSVSLDRLIRWLGRLGRTVDVKVKVAAPAGVPPRARRAHG